MRIKNSLAFLIIVLFSQGLFSQSDNSRESSFDRSPFFKQLFDSRSSRDFQPIQDYKIISSTSSYIEIEFTPFFYQSQKIKYNNREFIVLDFENAIHRSVLDAGKPDLKERSFPIIFPSMKNNSVTVIDYDVTEVKGITLAPVAGMKYRMPGNRSFENMDFTYETNESFYGKNTFYPENIAEVTNLDEVRDIISGNLVISPYQYNPATGVLKQYSRIRVRVNFGSTPVSVNRPRSREEINLLKDIAINSNLGLGWINPRLINYHPFTGPSNSVLASGNWYKIEIKDNASPSNPNGQSEGMYKITKSFLTNSGINLSGIDPRKIKMYGNGGGMLPIGLNETRPVDLEELRIFIQGENDGSFDDNDYIVFYARSIHNWKTTFDTLGNVFYNHSVDFYSHSNYYWIKIDNDGNNGNRIQTVNSPNQTNPITPTSFTEKIFKEPEDANLILEGNVWLSNKFSNNQSYDWNNTLTGVESNSEILYKARVASRVLGTVYGCPWQIYHLLKEKNSNASELSINLACVYLGFSEWISAAEGSFTVNSNQLTSGEQSTFQSKFVTTAPDGDAYIDWMEIQYKRRLNSFSGDAARFNSVNANGTVEYNVSSFTGSDIKVYEVTEHNNVSFIQPISISSGTVKFQKVQNQNQEYKFSVYGSNGYKTPVSISSKIDNQDYRGGYNDGADMIMITPKEFLSAAQRLKTKREMGGPGNPAYLKTYIFETDKIMNEFGGGVLDAVAIRDFIKHCYETWTLKPAYVFFFGDGSLDYKNLLGQNQAINFVPVYEVSDPQIHQVYGYVTDDFYVDVVGGDTERPDLANSRMSFRSLEDANYYLDKVDCYENPASNGFWKNRCVYVADDAWTPGGQETSVHTDQAEQLAEQFTPRYIEKKKIFIVTYPTVITSQGRRKPDANLDIAKYWNEGCLMLNYTGHGSPDVWAHEYILEKDVILSQLHNECRYPFVTIASCDFSKYDNPYFQSGGELFSLAVKKGAIGTFAASRPTFSQSNAELNNAFWQALFFTRDTLLLQNRFSKALFTAKRIRPTYEANEKKYIAMVDASTRVQQPRYQSRIDSISGLVNDTMQALSRIKIFGTVMHPDSTEWNSFNGSVYLKLFDVSKQIIYYDEFNIAFNFRLDGGIIFSGNQNVTNGKFIFEFIVPKDISYLNKNGKLIDYFYNSTDGDGIGLDSNFIVGGINPNAPLDTTGPRISLFLNNRNFRSGDVVNENSTLIADLFDESGINTTGTIGHRIEAIIDNDINKKYDVTGNYNSDTSYKSGSLSYDLTNLSLGQHKLTLTAWDTYNNSSSSTIEFNVTSSGGIQVLNVYNFPNPFKDNTSFTFQHNFTAAINVKIKIYTVSGRLIKEIAQNNVSDKFVKIDWTGKDEDGETLGNGIYIYKLVVDDGSGQTIININKLAVLK